MKDRSCYAIIQNQLYGNPDPYNEELFTEIKKWVAGTARGKRKERILRCPMSGVELKGILSRLYIDTETLDVYYIAGQYYPEELATIRDLFD